MAGSRACVAVASTGNDSERIETIDITSPGKRQAQVAMSLGTGDKPESSLPDLAPGDRLLVATEAEVTTDPTVKEAQAGSPHVGEPYDFAPRVEVRLLLAAGESETEPGQRALKIGRPQCRRLTHREHHGLIVFNESRLDLPNELPDWLGGSRFVNLVVEAFSADAHDGCKHKLLVGENEADGSVGQDKGRINVVRLRGSTPTPTRQRSCAAREREIPVTKGELKVLYSLPLENLAAGEQLLARALFMASASHLEEPARISTRLILTDDAGATAPKGRAQSIASFGGEIGEHNGFNLLPERGPTATRRVGVARINEHANQRLFLSLVVDTGSPFHGLTADDKLRVAGPGYLEVTRYGAELKG